MAKLCVSGFSLAVALLYLLSLAQTGTSLRCYDCKSAFNGHCDNIEVKATPDETCDFSKLVKAFPEAGSKFVCVIHKMEQPKDASNLSVVRGCAPEKYCTFFNSSKECVTCDTDLCNSSSVVLPSIVLMFSFMFLRYF